MEQRAHLPPVRSHTRHRHEGGVKDTVESILVAFILAFIFRAFIVEAFVIPTGSMAPTLLGAHMRYRCPDCGYHFEVNYQSAAQGDGEIHIPPTAGRAYTIICPNCGYQLPLKNPDDPENRADNPVVHYGDRILVLKYLYLFEQPRRWDVVVFKSPHPRDRDYTENYIKRLVGRPGESVMILDGDIYVAQDGDLSTFKVQTKPRRVQDALWRIVYDNDYYPRGLPRHDENGNPQEPFRQPWTAITDATSWHLGSGEPGDRNFTFKNLNGEAELLFDPDANPTKNALTDWLTYDAGEGRSAREGYRREYNVSDVMLSFVYHRREGTGPLRAQIRKNDHVFDAVITPESVSLRMDDQPIGQPVPLPSKSGPFKVDLLNVDYRASIRIDGREVAATTPEQYHPDIGLLLDAFRKEKQLPRAEVKIIGRDQECVLSHISLWRDVYYLNRAPDQRDPIRWATPADFPHNVMKLDDDQYFVLGDNSLVSLDARFWHEPIELPKEGLNVKAGVVPHRFMLGKAFFVYWPAGYSPDTPFVKLPSLVPNFGDMRFIH